MADPNLGTATVRTRLDTTGLRTGIDDASGQLQKFARDGERSLAKLGDSFVRVGSRLSLAVTVPITAMGTAFVLAASDAEETGSKFATVFRDIGTQAETAADRLGASFGLSSTNARRLLGDTGDLLTGFGFTQQAALDLSVEVNELAVDLASFTNFSGGAEGASQALTKALLGETESLKSLGIAIRQTDVEAKVLELTQQGLTFESERQAKAYATLLIAQEQSLNAIGDYARTSDSFANQTRGLRNDLNDLSVSFGEILLPAATRGVEVLRDIVQVITDLPAPVKTAGVVIGGLAAAIGPILVTVGGIIKALPLITAGIAGLNSVGLVLAGPGGWVIGAAVAIGALAVAIGRSRADRDSLVAATDEAQAALAAGDKASLVGALDTVAAKVDGETRASLQRLREDLIQTGDVSIEQAARIAGALAQARNLEPTATGSAANYSTAVREALTVAGQSLGRDVLGSVESALNNGELAFAIGDTGQAIDRLQRTIDGLPVRNPALERQRDVLVGFREELIAAQTEAIETGLRGFTTPAIVDPGTTTGAASRAGSLAPPGRAGGTPGAPSSGEVEDILAAARAWTGRLEAELRFGIKSAEDVFDLLQPRADDLRVAAGAALRDFGFDSREYQDAVTKLDFIDGVLQRLAREYNIDLAVRPTVDVRDRPTAEAAAAAYLPPGVRAGAEAAAAAQARAALSADELADAARIAADTQVALAAAQRDQLFAQAAIRGAGGPDPAAEAQARAAASQAAAAAVTRDTEALQDILIDTLRATVTAGGDVASVFDAIGRAGITLDDDLQAAFDSVSAEAGEASVDLVDLFLATQRVSDAVPKASRGLNDLADAAENLGQRAGPGAPRPVPIPLPGVNIDYLTPAPEGLEGIFGPGTGDEFRGIFDENGQQLVEMGEFSSQQIQDAATDFRLQVAQAAVGFTFTLIDQLKKGDIAGAIGTAFNAAGSVAGALSTFGPAALGLTAASAATAGLAAVALPIVGGLISGIAGLFGGSRTGADPAADREREANERRQRSTPAITITANVSQTNNFGSDLVDPRTRAEVDRLTRQAVGEVLRQTGYADIRRAALGAAT